MSEGEFLPSGGAHRRKKPLTAAQRKKVLRAYQAVPHIQLRNDTLAAADAETADDLLDTYFNKNHAQDKDHHDPRASNGQRGTAPETAE